MSTWEFNPKELTIRNLKDGEWEINLKELKSQNDLLHWLLQAARHEFDMKELFDEFEKAIAYCFHSDGINGAVMLQELYNTFPINNGDVDWVKGVVLKRKI